MTYKLEDMLNDCAVIRATFEALDLFPADDPICEEMMDIVTDARANMCGRCVELRDNAARLVLLGSSLNMRRLRQAMQTLLLTGYPRRSIDACMKVNVFQTAERGEGDGSTPNAPYRYTLLLPLTVPAVLSMTADILTALILDDLRQSIERDANFQDKTTFDSGVFQKYIAFMFTCLRADNPFFY